ncbi:hypothetical protein [Anaerocolumna jejuensis]|uniref:hypothetical protein n=1 Tax=Anaerocolumna jejuensis TaxID=259063 RepID=UPI003F7C78FA
MTIHVVSLEKTILVKTNIEINIDIFSFWVHRFCSNAGIFVCDNCDAYNYTLYIQKADERLYMTEASSSLIGIENMSDNDYPWIAKYISQIFEYFFELDNTCQIHSVSIGDMVLESNNDKAIMLLGDYWQGKTSIAVTTTNKFSDLKILSDFYTTFSNGKTVGYNKMIQLHNSNCHVSLSNEAVKQLDERTYFKNDNNDERERELIGIVVPHIRASDNVVRRVAPDEAFWFIYEKISILISGVTILFQGKVPSISFDNEILKKNRLSITNELIKIPMYYISTNAETIADEIHNLFINS